MADRPLPPPHPYLDHDGPIAFAHRGGHDVAPENTLASFDHAVELGYRYLETDAHLTADGVLVSFHDANLSRTTGVDAAISELTGEQLAEVRVGGEHRIPTMAELFERYPDVRFNIDAKSDAAVDPLAELVVRFDALDRVCLASFKLSRLRRLRARLGPGLLTNTSPSEIAALLAAGRVPGSAPRAAQVPTAAGRLTVVSERFVRRCRARGIPVHVWTINERAEMERLLALGVDGIMTDETAMLRNVMRDLELWQSG